MIARLPAFNALMNASSALLLGIGYLMIRLKKVYLHQLCMLAAFIGSSVFLVSYVIYHLKVGHVHYAGQGAYRTVYLAVLTSHTFLAAMIVPLVLRTLYLAVNSRFDEHRRWARWTLPLWFYVSVTGVVIYAMVY